MNDGRNPRPTVVIGLLGSTLDRGKQARRHSRWRPTVACVLQDDLPISRLELLAHPRHQALREAVTADLVSASPATQVVAHPFAVDDPWDFEEVYEALYGFARSYEFRPEEEDYLVHITTGTHVAQICLFLLTESRHIPARLLQTSPKIRTEPGPERARGLYSVIDLDLSKYDTLAARFAGERREGVDLLTDGIPTRDGSFAHMLTRIEQVAQASRSPILLTGPTGAGKTRLARRIFQLKKSKHQVAGAFVEVNCATLRGDGAMSALFGHVRGAFTGADGDREGLLTAADEGLLFLDEIGELGLDEQAMLLRTIEDKTFRPVGSDRMQLSDFQLVAGTNRDLGEQVRAGTFRDDLLARIDLWHFELPGLAQRRTDIEPNIVYELERFGRDHGRKVVFTRDAWQRYLTFATEAASWPGNFRDLGASVERLCTLAGDGRVTVDLVDEELDRLRRAGSGPALSGPTELSLTRQQLGPQAAEALDRFVAVQLEDVLRVCRQAPSLAAAGRILFSESRKTRDRPNDSDRLAKYLRRFDLRWQDLHKT